jgi:hypothetical protein
VTHKPSPELRDISRFAKTKVNAQAIVAAATARSVNKTDGPTVAIISITNAQFLMIKSDRMKIIGKNMIQRYFIIALPFQRGGFCAATA